MASSPAAFSFWSLDIEQMRATVAAGDGGLTTEEAERRLKLHGPNSVRPRRERGPIRLLLSQFGSPIVLILLAAALLSFLLHDSTDAVIIAAIILVSGLLGFWQEFRASSAIQSLLDLVEVRAHVARDGQEKEVPLDEVVPGDVVLLSAGDIVPGDSRILSCRDLFVDEATLTGETFPVEKTAGTLPAATPLAQRTNSLFTGTHVVSGTARAMVVATGAHTEFGRIAQRLALRPPETEFESGIRRLGYLLLEVTLVLVMAIFAFNVYLHRPVLDSFLFALALAVGLTPQLLPAIVSVNLAHGTRRMAARKVIVKRLSSIENFGAMDVLCSDKTGTLTEGKAALEAALDARGGESPHVLLLAWLNAAHETGFANPLDEALRARQAPGGDQWKKVDEVPYDFVRKRLSILAARDEARLMITKGSFSTVIDVCTHVLEPDGTVVALEPVRADVENLYVSRSSLGYRVLAVAYREIPGARGIARSDESRMIFAGLLVFHDPPKPGITATIGELGRLGVSLKIITGDSRPSALGTARRMGIPEPRILTGPEITAMSDAALQRAAGDAEIFAEIEPNAKERVILALRKGGRVVGYMGDGINDASALHAADVGISVESAADAAREAADIVLLEKDLGVLVAGVAEGRRTFANTLKYIFMATSANFGNMFSMAGASLFLPFLPLLPTQILLTNVLTDLPEMTIATDEVDPEMLTRPRRWDIRFIRRFMLVFGVLSSLFDYLTFGALLLVLRTSVGGFRSGWFLESVLSASLIVLILRTRRPFISSRPGRWLLAATLGVAACTLALPWTPLGRVFQLAPPAMRYLPILLLILGLYALGAEMVKKIFFRFHP